MWYYLTSVKVLPNFILGEFYSFYFLFFIFYVLFIFERETELHVGKGRREKETKSKAGSRL